MFLIPSLYILEKKILISKCKKQLCSKANNPANIYLFKVNNRNTRKRCEICSKLTIKTPERRQSRPWDKRVLSTNFYFLRFLLELVCRCINYTLTTYTLLMLFSIVQNNQNKLVLSPFHSFLSEKKSSILYPQHRTFFH